MDELIWSGYKDGLTLKFVRPSYFARFKDLGFGQYSRKALGLTGGLITLTSAMNASAAAALYLLK